MNPIMNQLCLAIICLFAATGFLQAATGGGGAGQRQAWFVFTDLPSEVDNPIMLRTGGDVNEVLLSSRSPSQPARIHREGRFEVVRALENPPADGEDPYEVIGRGTIPEGVRRALVILAPAPRNNRGMLVQMMVRDLADFNGGEAMYLNMTRLQVGVELGDDRIVVQPGQMEVHNRNARNERQVIPIRYHFMNPESNEWDLISASTVVMMPTRREICIFTWDHEMQRVRYRGITMTGM